MMHPLLAGVTQLVECQPSKLNVAGSIPVTRFQKPLRMALKAMPQAAQRPHVSTTHGFSYVVCLKAPGSHPVKIVASVADKR